MTRSTPPGRCDDLTDHGRHEWYWLHLLRRDCSGLTTVDCGSDLTHIRHWVDEARGLRCRGAGLAGICEHRVGMLNECRACTPRVF